MFNYNISLTESKKKSNKKSEPIHKELLRPKAIKADFSGLVGFN